MILSGEEVFSPPHAEFRLDFTPVSHTLCGDFAYTAAYDGTPIGPTNNQPLDYDPATRTFTAESDDTILIGKTKPYSVTASLADHPTAQTVTASSTITFNDPCDDPFSFSSTAQTDPARYAYQGSATFELTPFSIDPSFCPVSYACTSVVRDDGQTNTYIDCADFSNAGTLVNGSSGKPELSFTATEQQYIDGDVVPGVYTVTITGTATDSGDTQTSTFDLVIADPCYPPTSITAPGIADQSYTLTTPSETFTPSDFQIVPTFCPFDVSY